MQKTPMFLKIDVSRIVIFYGTKYPPKAGKSVRISVGIRLSLCLCGDRSFEYLCRFHVGNLSADTK